MRYAFWAKRDVLFVIERVRCTLAPSLILYGVLAGLLLMAGAKSGFAQEFEIEGKGVESVQLIPEEQAPSPEDVCVLERGDFQERTHVHTPSYRPEVKQESPTADITVNYTGFTQEAREAFERAVEIWERHIQSDAEILIDASYESFGPQGENVLGRAGPFLFLVTLEDGDQLVYPAALFDALVGPEQAEGGPHMQVEINEDINWYFGEPAPIGPGPNEFQSDLTSVALHEIAHGLGFTGSMSVDLQGVGSWDYSSLFGEQAEDVPNIYDEFAADQFGDFLTESYSNPSSELGDVLQSRSPFTEGVFFDGPEAEVGAEVGDGPPEPKLYAPSDWRQGSSYSHVDRETYPQEDINSLMRPVIRQGETVHTPGPITCGMFADMGWPKGPGCETLLEAPVALFEGQPEQRNARFSWVETGRSGVSEYIIEGRYFPDEGSSFQEVKRVASRGPDDYVENINIDELAIDPFGEREDIPRGGDYEFRLSYVPEESPGEKITVSNVRFTVPLEEERIISEIYPNPFSEGTNIRLGLQGEGNENVPLRIEVYNSIGQKVDVLFDGDRRANDPRPVEFNSSDYGYLPSGRYFFRVIGDGFEETRSAVLVR